MSRLDELPPDQRAALSLLLAQHKSYAEVAKMLGIAERAVHDRAHAALAVLAPRQARELSAERREEVGNYLLGQQPGVAERLRTRTYLSASEPARAWAQALASELAPLAGGTLPEIPLAGAAGALPDANPSRPPAAFDEPAAAGPDAAAAAGPARTLPSSRVGGALLLVAIIAAVVVAIVLLSGGGSSKRRSGSAAATASGAARTSTGPTIGAKLPMRSPNPASRSIGLVQLLSEGSKRAFYLVAEHMPATNGFFYALWLANSSSSSVPLGKAPPVGSNHRLEGGGLLPSNAGNFHEILLTRETSTHATSPGPVVLRGAFSFSH